MATETVLVTGGTGTVGRALVNELLTHPDVLVRVLTRNQAAVAPAGASVHLGEFGDEDSLQRAMTGCTRVFLLTSGTLIAQHDASAARAAVRTGVMQLVKLSALGVGRGGQDPITR